VKIRDYEFPDDLYYDRYHGWARLEGNKITTGITDFAQKLAGEIVYIALPARNRTLERDKPYVSLESGKWVGRVNSPVAGKVLRVNTELEDDPAPLNDDPYGEGWIAEIEMAEPASTEAFMRTGPDLEAFIQSEIDRIEQEKAEREK
jgi:glycine cleavage system H protein